MCEGRPDICGIKVPDFKRLLDGYQKDGRDTAVTLNTKSVTCVPASTYDSASGSAMEIEYPYKLIFQSQSRFHKTLPDSPESWATDDLVVSSNHNLETPSVLGRQYESTSANVESLDNFETAAGECSDKTNSTFTQIHQQTPYVRVIDSQHMQVSVGELLHSQSREPLDDSTIRTFCMEGLKCLADLEDLGIGYQDSNGDVFMKLENILHLTIKGFSYLDRADQPNIFAGLQPELMAPEVAKFIMQDEIPDWYQFGVNDRDITIQADIFSLARIVMELYPSTYCILQRIFRNGRRSYDGMTDDDRRELRLRIVEQIASVDCMQLLVPDESSTVMKDLLCMMLEQDPRIRITARQALKFIDNNDDAGHGTRLDSKSNIKIEPITSDNTNIPGRQFVSGGFPYAETKSPPSSTTSDQTSMHKTHEVNPNNSGNEAFRERSKVSMKIKKSATVPVPRFVKDTFKVDQPCNPSTLMLLKKRIHDAGNESDAVEQAKLPRLDTFDVD
ncbi:uncharacterized protein LOC127866823 isoform X3 [Dreissena polymorpha]|uniref:uncharacterized protein LOC127866823 isoform X3 n=1 Tax=Dreissena polymorpha TaxID=45954 RepID=UPI002263BC7E|nr:uncharacterized protein LOC127866823 isoform X3 [Dreissena polymorpha]XP_052263610.1 uncharacterized protein LOC127866823 isoform X4 [Dreissena polymorpha]XP_052263611.1 uncharacterized protein LOC127866823 isoform X3 [Dreissena polymorpha]